MGDGNRLLRFPSLLNRDGGPPEYRTTSGPRHRVPVHPGASAVLVPLRAARSACLRATGCVPAERSPAHRHPWTPGSAIWRPRPCRCIRMDPASGPDRPCSPKVLPATLPRSPREGPPCLNQWSRFCRAGGKAPARAPCRRRVPRAPVLAFSALSPPSPPTPPPTARTTSPPTSSGPGRRRDRRRHDPGRLDGDQETVRLIGIDTPETMDPDTPTSATAPRPATMPPRLLQGRTVWLETRRLRPRPATTACCAPSGSRARATSSTTWPTRCWCAAGTPW